MCPYSQKVFGIKVRLFRVPVILNQKLTNSCSFHFFSRQSFCLQSSMVQYVLKKKKDMWRPNMHWSHWIVGVETENQLCNVHDLGSLQKRSIYGHPSLFLARIYSTSLVKYSLNFISDVSRWHWKLNSVILCITFQSENDIPKHRSECSFDHTDEIIWWCSKIPLKNDKAAKAIKIILVTMLTHVLTNRLNGLNLTVNREQF